MTVSGSSSAVELLVSLRRDDPDPLYRQLEQELRQAVRSGRLGPDALLPSTRTLAGELGVTRGVVVSAYEQLTAEGYLISRPGGTTRVARVPTRVSTTVAARQPPRFRIDFRPGRPDLAEFPRASWLRSVRRVLNDAPADRFSYLDGHGMPELRSALSAYLDRVRGTSTSPDSLIISSGFAQGLRLIALALRASGTRRIGVEDPSHPDYRGSLVEAGLEVVPIPVDAYGMRVDLLEMADVQAVVVTSAHQYPTGVVLAPGRREELVAWADRRDATIIEDDYDAEFRYDRMPIGAMQGLCGDRVVYAGTASKTLAPGLRLGWLAVPHRFVERVATAKTQADNGSSALDQLALADFIERGELDRHLRRMRAIYRGRRDRVLESLARHLPRVRPVGASAGLHVLAWLPSDIDEKRLIDAALAHGIRLDGIADAYVGPRRAGGIIFGYGSIDEQRIEEGIATLASLFPGI